MPSTSQPRLHAARTAARITAFNPGASPPPVVIAMRMELGFGRARVPAARRSAARGDQREHFGGLHVPSGLRFLVDRRAVHHDLEPPALRRDEFDHGLGILLADRRRHTGGAGFIASDGAVFDRDLHRIPRQWRPASRGLVMPDAVLRCRIAAAPRSIYRPLARRGGRMRAGHTLAELLIVLLIASVLLAIGAPRVWAARDQAIARSGATELVATLSAARAAAQRRDARAVVALDTLRAVARVIVGADTLLVHALGAELGVTIERVARQRGVRSERTRLRRREHRPRRAPGGRGGHGLRVPPRPRPAHAMTATPRPPSRSRTPASRRVGSACRARARSSAPCRSRRAT